MYTGICSCMPIVIDFFNTSMIYYAKKVHVIYIMCGFLHIWHCVPDSAILPSGIIRYQHLLGGKAVRDQDSRGLI